MQKPSDEALIAYLDGELDEAAAQEMRAALMRDSALALRANELRESAGLLRAAFDDVLHESVPERLIMAARGLEPSRVVRFPEPRQPRTSTIGIAWQRWATWSIAASLACLLLGGTLGYLIATSKQTPVAQNSQQPPAQTASTETGNWIENFAGYHRMLVNAGANDAGLIDVPADPKSNGGRPLTQQLPSDFRLPNMKPWNLEFQGTRFLFVDGQPGVQLFYTTNDKSLGPISILIADTTLGDKAPTPEKRGELNVFYWRHQGHIYAIVGTANVGYLWNIYNDLAWQLNAI